MSEEKDDSAKRQAILKLASIREQIDRLNHCDDCDDIEECELDRDVILSGVNVWSGNDISTEDLHKYIEQYHDREDVERTIWEDLLSIEVRGDWHVPGDEEQAKPTEYKILLCWGGPAVQLKGELDQYGEPGTAWLEYQDWFEPWTKLLDTTSEDNEALLSYAQQFVYGY